MIEPAISVRNLSKCYRLGVIGRQTLADEMTHLWHRLRGRDPRAHMGKVGYSATEARRVESEESGDERFWALKDVTFDVQPGEIVGVIGRNGAGKSTLLKVLTRITEPTSGEGFINGRVASLLEVGTGFHPELTGRENVFMNGTILGMKQNEIGAKFDEIVAFAELEKFIDTPVKRYSSGMYVRLAFAVAAHLEPEILLIDEVLAVGDVAFQKKCLGKMKDVANAGRTVLFVSHNMMAINNLCSRGLLFENGSLTVDSTAEVATDSYLGCQVAEKGFASKEDIERRMEGVIHKDDPSIIPLCCALSGPDGEPVKKLNSDSPIQLKIEFECLRTIPDLRLVFQILDKNNAPVYGAQCTDDISVAQNFSYIKKGMYRVVSRVPANTFGAGTYFLTWHVLQPRQEHIVLNRIIEFEIEFKGYNKEIQYGGGSWCSIWPSLDWKISCVNNAEGRQ